MQLPNPLDLPFPPLKSALPFELKELLFQRGGVLALEKSRQSGLELPSLV